MSYHVIQEAHDVVLNRYREISNLARVTRTSQHGSTFVGFVTSDGSAFRFANTPTVGIARFDDFVAGIESSYRPLVIYAVHH